MISNLSATSKIKVSNLDLDKNDIYFKLEDLEITPKGVEQKFKSKKYGYDNVTVKAVESEELNIIPSTETQINDGLFNKVTVIGDSNLIPENIVKGITIFGVEGITNATNAKIIDCYYLFYGGHRVDNMKELLELCDWNLITNCQYMFNGCQSLITLDVSNFNTSNVTNMYGMFYACKSLTTLDVSNFNTSNVTNMSSMFSGCLKLTELDVSNFNTNNVTDMNGMFYDCESLTELDVSNFNTSNVTNMSSMFNICNKLTELDVSNFDTSNVTNMTSMFYACHKLTTLDLNNFDMSKVNNTYRSIGSCSGLINLVFGKNLGKGYTQKSANYSNYSVSLNDSTKLTHDSLMNVINNLYDLNLTYDVANGGTLYTQKLTLSSSSKSKLTADDIAIATNKGWTVS